MTASQSAAPAGQFLTLAMAISRRCSTAHRRSTVGAADNEAARPLSRPRRRSGSSTPFSSRSPSRFCLWRRSATSWATGVFIGAACLLHCRFARLRARADIRRARVRTRFRAWARRECSAGHLDIRTRPVHLSARAAWPRDGQHGGGGRRLLGRKRTLAAAILSIASWHWLFLINVPIGVVALIMAARTLPVTPRAPGGLDPLSVLLNALAFGLVIAGVNGIGQGECPGFGAVRDRCRYRDRRGACSGTTQAVCAAAAVGFFCAVRCWRAFVGDVHRLIFSAQALAIVSLFFTLRTGLATRHLPPDCCSRLGRSRHRLDRANRRTPGRRRSSSRASLAASVFW